MKLSSNSRCSGIILVYDVTNEKTFANISNWLRNIDENAKEDVEKILVGNKTDLESQRRISTEKGQNMAIEYGLKLIETSAKVGKLSNIMHILIQPIPGQCECRKCVH